MDVGNEREREANSGNERQDDEGEDEDEEEEEDIHAKYGISSEGKTRKQILIILLAEFVKNLHFNKIEHSVAEFLENINYNAVLGPLTELVDAMNARQTIKNLKAQVGTYCGTIISALNNEKDEAETAIALVEYWKIVPEFEQYLQLQAVDSRFSRALLMLSSSKAYSWVVSIVTEAIEFPTKESWVSQLAKDVQREWKIRHQDPTAPPKAIFNSKDYLPSMSVNCEATVTLKRRMLKDEEDGLRMIRIVSFIIETWLQFPSSRHQNSSYKVRCALISITTKHMPLSVLLLDDIWKMYLKPYHSVIHGRAPGQRIRQSHTEKILNLFEESIQNHAMTNPTSKEHQLLKVLNQYSQTYHQLTSPRTRGETQATLPNSNVRLNVVLYFIFLILVRSQSRLLTHWQQKPDRSR